MKTMQKFRIVAACLVFFLLTISCRLATGEPVSKGSVVTGVTLAHDSNPETYEAIDPSKTFGPQDVIHAIVSVQGAPQGTLFTARWVVVDVGDPAQDEVQMDVTETEQRGSGNLDFTLSPNGRFLPGAYRVEIYVNNELVEVREYLIIDESGQ